MKWHFPFAALLLLSTSAFATEQIRKAQTGLKEEGFYFGETTGESTPEFTAALRRYQIRNGLEVTGELNSETLEALGLKASAPIRPTVPAKRPQATPAPAPPVARSTPPVHLRKNDAPAVSDRDFLESEVEPPPQRTPSVPPYDRSIGRQPAPPERQPLAAPGKEYVRIFAGTPYATAPREVQNETLRHAQTLLARRGFYRDAIDGDPGPATEEAIFTYQRTMRFPLTGRLDLQTLSGLRLLPGRGPGNPPLQPFRGPGGSRQPVVRGIWVQ